MGFSFYLFKKWLVYMSPPAFVGRNFFKGINCGFSFKSCIEDVYENIESIQKFLIHIIFIFDFVSFWVSPGISFEAFPFNYFSHSHIPLDPHHFKVHLHSFKVNNISTQSTWGSYPRVNDCTAIAFHWATTDIISQTTSSTDWCKDVKVEICSQISTVWLIEDSGLISTAAAQLLDGLWISYNISICNNMDCTSLKWANPFRKYII